MAGVTLSKALPTSAAPPSLRLLALQEKLAEELDDGALLAGDLGTAPQGHALKWLALEGPVQLDLDVTPLLMWKG